jgi:hypothetical protein
MRAKQADTYAATTRAIMNSPEFAVGVADVRAGKPFDYDRLDGSWEYERGRLWAWLAPVSMPLKIKGKLNPKAVLFDLAFQRKYLL